MKLRSIQIRDWGPFRGSHRFELPDAPGLYFLWGRNEAEPRLGSNGAGKTRIWEAVCWCLHGKTSKGLKAGDVANWEVGKNASVTLEIMLPDGKLPVFMERIWSPNSWTLKDLFGAVTDLTKDGTNEVAAALRLSFEAFLHAGLILKSPSRPMFLDLKAEAKAALFSEVMGLDRWLDLAQKASKKAAAEDEECREIEQSLARLEGRIEQIGTTQDDAGEQWALERNRQRRAIKEDHERELQRHNGIRDTLDQAKSRQHKASRNLTHALLQAGNKVARVTKEAQTLEVEIRTKMRELGDAEKHHAMLDELDEAECPTCGQLVTGAHLDKEWQKAADLISKIESESRALDKEAGEIRDDHLQAIAEQVAIEREVEADRDERRQAERLISDLTLDLNRSNQKLDQLEEEDERLRSKVNPHEVQARERSEQLEALKRDHRRLQRQLDDKLSRWKLFTHWAKWFKEIRLEQISEALQQLEIEVNSQVVALGLVNWSMSFAVDRETASGSLQRGFSVTVTSPHNSRAVPWEVWSGGEAQRLRIAAQEGLANLIRSQTGSEFNLECWDEPTDGMSAQGIQDLLIALAERAEIEQRQIWVIDHHSLSFGGFAGQVGVIKTKEGSRFDFSALYS